MPATMRSCSRPPVRATRSPAASPRPSRCGPTPRRRPAPRCRTSSCWARSATGAERRGGRAAARTSQTAPTHRRPTSLEGSMSEPLQQDSAAAGRVWLLADNPRDPELVFDFPFNEELNEAVKQLPRRWFDWRRRNWRVPADPRLGRAVEEGLGRFPELVAEPEVLAWLTDSGKWKALVTVVARDGRGAFVLRTISGDPPPERASAETAGEGRLLLPFDRASAELLRELEGLQLDDLALGCARDLRAGREPAGAELTLEVGDDAELDGLELGGELHPFQRAGVRYALARRRTFIADEQGLGKTVQALATLESDGAFPAVVVCPASMKLTWERESLHWLPERSVAVLDGRADEGWSEEAGEAEIVVLNYDILEAHLERLVGRSPRAVVFDESHYVKNPGAARTKAALALAERAPENALRLALTGTPVLNRAEELVAQLRVLGRLREFGSGARLTRRFRSAGSDDRLHWNLRARCYVRRTKQQVLPQLPSKRHDTVPVLLSNEQEYRLAEQDVIAWLQSLPLDLRTIDAKVAAALRAEQLVRLNNLRQLAARGKLPTALAWIADFLESGEPLVVFAEHISTQRAVLERFPSSAHILGSDTSHQRQYAVDAFQDPDGPQLIVCALKAASQGITLTRASNVAFLELDWTPARHDQAEDRLHRIGQESAVTAWYLLAPDTIDETMAALLERKRGLIDAVTDGQVRDEERLVDGAARELRSRPFRHLRVVA